MYPWEIQQYAASISLFCTISKPNHWNSGRRFRLQFQQHKLFIIVAVAEFEGAGSEAVGLEAEGAVEVARRQGSGNDTEMQLFQSRLLLPIVDHRLHQRPGYALTARYGKDIEADNFAFVTLLAPCWTHKSDHANKGQGIVERAEVEIVFATVPEALENRLPAASNGFFVGRAERFGAFAQRLQAQRP